MTGSDEIYVVTALGLELQHYGCECFVIDLGTCRRIMADIKVLAEAAAEAATREKYRARSMAADQGLLLSEMAVVTGDHCLVRRPAYPGLGFEPVNAASPRAEGAVVQRFAGQLSPLLENARIVQYLSFALHRQSVQGMVMAPWMRSSSARD